MEEPLPPLGIQPSVEGEPTYIEFEKQKKERVSFPSFFGTPEQKLLRMQEEFERVRGVHRLTVVILLLIIAVLAGVVLYHVC